MSEIDARVARVAALQHGTLRLDQIADLTAQQVRWRVRSGRWDRIGLGAYRIAGSPQTWEQHIWIALHRAGAGAAVGRRSAARLHQIPGFQDDHVDVSQPERTVPRERCPTSRRTSYLPDHHVVTVSGFPSTTIERTIFDLAGLTSLQRRRRGWVWLPEQRVERAIDDLLVRKRTTVGKLRAVFIDLAGHGRPGTQLMRTLIETRAGGEVPTESALESLFVRFLTDHGLPVPRRQVPLGSGKTFIGRVDFFYDDLRLIVEVDGSRFHDIREVARRDKRRDLQLLAEGWDTIRIDWAQLKEESSMTATLLRKALAKRQSIIDHH